MRIAAAAAVALLAITASSRAPEPGEPMDCSDLILAPGYTCSEVVSPSSALPMSGNESRGLSSWTLIDNDQRVLALADEEGPVVGDCGAWKPQRFPLLRLKVEETWEPLVSFEQRCTDTSIPRIDRLYAASAHFDAVRGDVHLGLTSSCQNLGPGGTHCDEFHWSPGSAASRRSPPCSRRRRRSAATASTTTVTVASTEPTSSARARWTTTSRGLHPAVTERPLGLR